MTTTKTGSPLITSTDTHQRESSDRPGAGPRALPHVEVAPRVTFGRLVAVEFRKLVDTRTSLALDAIAVLGAVGVAVGITALYRPFADIFGTGWAVPAAFISFPITLLVPIAVVLLFTQEWGQRTMLTTFAVEPRRGRVLAAKGVVALVISVLGWALSQGLSAVTTLVGTGVIDQAADWGFEPRMLLGQLGTFLLSSAMAAAFALVIMNSPAAIVMVMALPSVVQTIGMFGETGQRIASWIDVATTSQVLTADDPTTMGWVKLAAAVSLWIIVPGAIGVWRNLTREAK
ncbi:hypothetical protein ACQCX5_04680 [Propionibacteriaceae bacterium G57]|uniref:hypothetical protein n=1 Tax=Aestuariimicrobium sp. G57 TaxID=3418485 RepID=UPI003DA72E67